MEITLEGLRDVQTRLHAAPKAVQNKALLRVAKAIIKNSKARARAQADVEGRAYKPHARGRKRKMLTRLIKYLKVLWSSDQEAVIGFSNPVHAEIAAKQQLGFTQHVVKPEADLDGSRKGMNYYHKPATRKQAKALVEAGYKVRPKGKAYYTPSIRWITKNMTIGRAGYMLNLLRGSKEVWQTVLPARSFLGVAGNEIAELTALALSEAQQALNQNG